MKTLKISCLLLFFLASPLLNALDYGFRLNIGLSGGSGAEWQTILEEAGSKDFSDVLATAALGVFFDFPSKGPYRFVPELNYALNRGIHISTGSGEFIKTSAIHSAELVLPLTRRFPLKNEKMDIHILGGFQYLFSPFILQRTEIGGVNSHNWRDNEHPLSMGLVLGSWVELKSKDKRSWIFDIRVKVPLSPGIGYLNTDGSLRSLKTFEVLMGGGILLK